MSPLPKLKALSIRQPWAWFILHAGKRLENRDWSERYPARRFRGDFMIHAAAGMTRDDYESACSFAFAVAGVSYVPKFEELPRGGIVGRARVVDYFEEYTSGDLSAGRGTRIGQRNIFRTKSDPWWMGPGALVLEDVQPLPFTPCRGMLGFFWPEVKTS